jgi:hypothetical protein
VRSGGVHCVRSPTTDVAADDDDDDGEDGRWRRWPGFKHHNSSTLVHAHTRLRELAGSTRLPTRTFMPGEFLIRQGERTARCNSVRRYCVHHPAASYCVASHRV